MKHLFVTVLAIALGVGSALAQETCESKAVSADGTQLAGAAKKSFVQNGINPHQIPSSE